jgi:hypothetical protein
MDSIIGVLESPLTSLLAALIFGGIALTGRFSVRASQIMLFFAWIVFVIGLQKQPWPVLVGLAVLGGGSLILVAYFFRPETIPKFTGTLSPKSRLISLLMVRGRDWKLKIQKYSLEKMIRYIVFFDVIS